MDLVRPGLLLLFGLISHPAAAECLAVDFDAVRLQFSLQPPPAPDPMLRPILPECLRGLSGPEHENCPRSDLAKYGEEIDKWVEELNDYARATNRFANQVAEFANSAVEYAEQARVFADTALQVRDCEARAIYAPSAD